MLAEQPARYSFYTAFFAKVPILDRTTGQIIGGKQKEQFFQLQRYNQSKILVEQLNAESPEMVPNSYIVLNMVLNS